MGQESDSSDGPQKSPDGGAKRLIDRFREAIRSRHYSLRTEQAYWYWIRYFVFFHDRRHPAELGGGGSDGVSVLAGDRAQRRGGDAESGAIGASLSLSEGAWRRAAVARAVDAREAAGARAGGAHRGGGAAAAGAAAWRQMGH